jgi:hypothetical protein
MEDYSMAMAKDQRQCFNGDHVDAATKESLWDEKEKMEEKEKIDEERDFWSDRVFMERLNDFLADENSYSHGEGFFIQCEGFLG